MRPPFRLKDMCQISLAYGACKAADAMEAMGLKNYADGLRGWNYYRQIRRLQRHLGQEVMVLSSSFGSPVMAVEPGAFGLMSGGYSPNGVYVHHQGRLSAVEPFSAIEVEDADDVGSVLGMHSLPFLGTSSIREVRRSRGNLLYFNPEVEEGFFRRYNGMQTEEKWEQMRRTFGRDRERFMGEMDKI